MEAQCLKHLFRHIAADAELTASPETWAGMEAP
jgi:hypothetical protein